jgi:hypothetical protein
MNKDERIEHLRSKLTLVGRPERLWVKGAFQDLPIYRAPTELLLLNADNRRFRAESQRVAAELGRRLDPTNNSNDQQSVISLLLDREPELRDGKVIGKPSKEATALLYDWEKRTQEHPLWIRPDGLVHNGNRRLAMIKREQSKRDAEFGSWVEVIVFAEDEYDDDVLFDLESREQLTEGLKVRYSDINLLLTLKDAAEREAVDWADPDSVRDTANRIQHLVNNDPDYALIQLNAIKYMTLYLEHFERPGQYHELQGMVERFREVGKIMSWVRDEDSSREDTALTVLFAAVTASSTHLDLRDLRRLLREDPEEFDRAKDNIRELEDEAEPEPEDLDEPEPSSEDDEYEEDEAQPETPSPVTNYPKHAVRRVVEEAIQPIRDAKRDDKRGQVLSVAKRLGNISPEDLRPHLDGGAEAARLRSAIAGIVAWADTVRDLADEA